MQYLALDIGSSSIKGALLDLERRQIGATIRRACPGPVPGLPPRHFEIDPTAVIQATEEVLDELVASADAPAGLVSCTQMAGTILVDRQGQPLTRYLSWRDQRVLDNHPTAATSYYDHLHAQLTDRQRAELGGELKTGASTSLLYWLACQHQLPQQATPLGLGEYVWSRLCDAAPAVERTNALGALNLTTSDWHHAAFAALDLPQLQWPRLASPTEPIGTLSIGGHHLPCFPPLGDHQCALLGTRLEAGELSLNISTGSQVSHLSNQLKLGNYQTRTYFDGQFLNSITHLPAGRSLDVLVGLVNQLAQDVSPNHDPWPSIARAVQDTPDTDLDVDLAFFAGPLGNRGSISNIQIENLTIGTLFRAAFRNMAENYRRCADQLGPATGWQRLVLSGSLPQNSPPLLEAICQQFACAHRVCRGSEDTLWGLLIQALVTSGQASSFQDACQQIRHTFSGSMTDE